MIKHPQRRVPSITQTQRSQTLTQLGRQRNTTLRTAEPGGDRFHLRSELVERVGFGDVGGDVQSLELFTLGRANAAGPEQQQIGLQAEQALHVQLTVAAN
ncbi:hypothetical protein D3C85_1494760 [compost metagenome]